MNRFSWTILLLFYFNQSMEIFLHESNLDFILVYLFPSCLVHCVHAHVLCKESILVLCCIHVQLKYTHPTSIYFTYILNWYSNYIMYILCIHSIYFHLSAWGEVMLCTIWVYIKPTYLLFNILGILSQSSCTI